MIRIGILTWCAVLWTGVGPCPTAAQTTSKIAVVGRLHPGPGDDPAQMQSLRGFREGMRSLGHIEGQTYVLEARFAGGDARRLPALAAELVRLRADVILATGSAAVRSAKNATQAIPIVMATVAGDPVRAGFVASLARPGGNVTGIAGLLDELNTKQLEFLREFVPGLPKVAIMYNPELRTRESLQRITTAAAGLGLKVHLAGVARPQELEPAFEMARRAKAGGLIVLPEPALMDPSRARIAELALRHRLPSVFTFRMYAEAGGLMSYSHDLRDVPRLAATYVDKILKGANPGDLPVEQPTKFELVINLKTAKALGLTIPPSLLLRAEQMIE